MSRAHSCRSWTPAKVWMQLSMQRLTDFGYSLKPILDAMWTWGEGYQKMMSPQPPEA